MLLRDLQPATRKSKSEKEAKVSWKIDLKALCKGAQPRQMEPNSSSEETVTYEQLLKYADDLAEVFQQEKSRREALEKANDELKREMQARHAAEKALRKARDDLEGEVQERTRELRETNRILESEISQRISAEEQTRNELREKAVLLSEVHHRVKNNLQMICSLLVLQGRTIQDDKVSSALHDSWCRVRAMALLHEQLYQSKNLANINMHEYVESLVRTANQAYNEDTERVCVHTSLDELCLSIHAALPCGLIVNELVTNCLKHAFPNGRRGEVRVEFKRLSDQECTLIVADNGRGLPEDLDYRASNSLGLDLLIRLAEFQLGGQVRIHTNGGTEVRITLPDLG
jgi:two-component sensor histidine kinase